MWLKDFIQVQASVRSHPHSPGKKYAEIGDSVKEFVKTTVAKLLGSKRFLLKEIGCLKIRFSAPAPVKR